MVDERQSNRQRWPELADAVDYLRAQGYTIERMWVEGEDGTVLAGRRPESEMHAVYVSPEAVVKADAARAERRALDEARRLNGGKRK